MYAPNRLSVLARSLLKTSGKSWYSFGTVVRSMDALEIAEWAFAVTSERASWKTSVPSILWMQANAAALTRAIFGASSFGGSSWGAGFRVAREVEACRGGDVGGDSEGVELSRMRYCPVPNQSTDCSR